MSKIFDNLFLGNYQDSKNERFLKRNGITHILCVGIELKPIFPDLYKYLHIPAYDSPGYKLSRYFEQVADFIHNAMENEGGKVFVHCYMGISRSTTSILAYMIKYQKVPPLKGRLFIKSKRGIIWPNDGFMRQLENYAKKLGVIDGKVSLKNLASSTATTTSFPAIKKEDPKPLEVKSATVTGNSLWKSGVIGETKSANKDYYCKSCGIKVFNTKDIEHDVNRTAGNNQCNVVYLKTLPGVLAAKSPGGKVFCPNTKCNSILGYADQKGGKCGCGHQLEKVYAVYPLRIIASKAKNPVTQPRPQANAETQALSHTTKAWCERAQTNIKRQGRKIF